MTLYYARLYTMYSFTTSYHVPLCTMLNIVYIQVEAVDLIAHGKAPKIIQPLEGATYDKIWKKKAVAEINWNQPAKNLHDFIRGNDKLPGAWSTIDGEQVSFYGSSLYFRNNLPDGREVTVGGLEKPALIHRGGKIK